MIDLLYLQEFLNIPITEETSHRLPFAGPKNFRDLGGYQTIDGGKIRSGMLYRSDSLNKLTNNDTKLLYSLKIHRIIDFRADHEREREPDRLPDELAHCLVKIPILDSSTSLWHDSRDEFIRNMKTIDPIKYMIQTNIELATKFTYQIKKFINELLSANSKPVVFHCAVGKDRTGFAAAVLLRILNVAPDVVMQDYLLTNKYLLPAIERDMFLLRLMKGKVFADNVKGFLDARPEYLGAAFSAIDQQYGSFDNYVLYGIALSSHDKNHLRNTYIEPND